MGAALEGIRVLDLSRIFAGPSATQLLGDLGADIIKVEEPSAGDEARVLGVEPDKPGKIAGTSPSFMALNRNKRSIALDLRGKAGQKIVTNLAASCDVLVHNFRPGVMRRWGLDYDAIATINPGIIYAEFSAYGSEGPMSGIGANDVAMQAHSGLMSITGETDGDPVRCGTAVVDLHGGMILVSAVLAALFHRERTGEGQRVGTSLLMSSANLMSYFYTEYWLDGTIRKPMGTANHLSVPNQTFPTSDGAVVIIAYADDMWARCVEALGAPHLGRPEYATAGGRRVNRRRLTEELSAVTSKMLAQDVVMRLAAVKVVVSKVNSIGEAADSSQLAHAGGVQSFEVEGRTVKAVGSPFQFSKTPTTFRNPPPPLGQHTEAILKEFGYSDDEVDQLGKEGAFGKTRIEQ